MDIPRVSYAGFAIVRSPLLPASELAVRMPSAASDLEARIQALVEHARTTPFREALVTSSPSLAAALAEPPRRPGAQTGVALAAMRYLERMRGRATPFGLCAGYTLVPADAARSAPDEAIQLTSRDRYTAVLRVDVDVVTNAIRTRDADHGAARWAPSREVTFVGDIARVYRRDPRGSAGFADLARSPALDAILALPDDGASLAEIATRLSPFSDDPDEREAYVRQLIELGVLVSSAIPAISTDDELSGLDDMPAEARAQRRGPIGAALLDAASAIESRFAPFVRQAEVPVGQPDPTNAPTARACLVDLLKETQRGAFGPAFLKELSGIVAVLMRFLPRIEDERLRSLRQHLSRRYESREVPLVEALDPDYGFEFPVEFDEKRPKDLDDWIVRRYADALAVGAREIVLSERDLPEGVGLEQLPVGFAMLCQVRWTDEGWAIDNPALVPWPGTAQFARAAGLDPEIRDRTRAFFAAQAALLPDADIAEVTYFVPGRSASTVQFPTLAPLEITLAGRPGLPVDRRVDVNDILIGVHGDRLVLRSRKTGRRLLPVGTGAANTNRFDMPSLARFLFNCGEFRYTRGFEWGPLANAPFLPRVRYGRHVLASAQWNLDAEQTRPLRTARTVEARFAATQALRARLGWPRNIIFVERLDHVLPVDLDDVLSVEAWLDILGERAQIREQLSGAESAVRGPEGAYQHEVVVPLLCEPKKRDGEEPRREAYDEAATFDRLVPGDRCLFLSIYGARIELLPIVTTHLRELLSSAVRDGKVTHWFFLPFADPDPHVRLRLFGPPEALLGELLPAIREALRPCLDSRAVRTFRVDTYERETVRYGGPRLMDACERVFWASSDLALVHHDAFAGDDSDINEVMPPFVQSVRAMLDAAGLTLADARAQARLTGELYARTDASDLKREAGALLRQQKATLMRPFAALDDTYGDELAGRLRRSLEEARAICEAEGRRPFGHVLADLLHVHSLRLLTVWSPIPHVEAIGYFLLEKILAGKLAQIGMPTR